MVLELAADGYDSRGQAVCRHEGKVVFVPHVVSGERILARITKESKNYSNAEIAEIIEVSPYRTKPVCPVFYQCGGCALMHMTYDEQLRFKKMKVTDALKKIAGIDSDIHDVIGMEIPYEYRNKVRYSHKDGEIGFKAQMSHDIVNTERCVVSNIKCDDIKNKLLGHIEKNPDIENITVRKSCNTKDLSVLFESFRKQDSYPVKELLDAFDNITSIDAAVGTKIHNLYGKGFITERLNNMTFKIYPKAFFQINTLQAENLIHIIRNMITKVKTKTAADIYCGTGTISLSIADIVDTIYGIDSEKDAIKAAVENAEYSNITNARFICSKAESIRSEQITYADTIILDPPRTGCHTKVVDWLIKMQPENIIYVSCNPSTLARDIKMLISHKYSCMEVWPIDMFPQTNHVECVVLIERV